MLAQMAYQCKKFSLFFNQSGISQARDAYDDKVILAVITREKRVYRGGVYLMK